MSNEPKDVKPTSVSNDGTANADLSSSKDTDIDISVSQSPDSPGKQLSIARQKLGLSQQQVADRLHLRLNSVTAVEQDELEPGVSVTFNKGYVRLYAKLVQLDAQPLLDAYDKIHVQDRQPAKLQSFSRRVTREASDQRWNMVTIVVILLVVGSVIGWWVQQSDSFTDSQNFVSETIDNLFSEEDTQQDAQDDTIEQEPQANLTTSGDDADIQKLDTGPQIPEEAVTALEELNNEQVNNVANQAMADEEDDLDFAENEATETLDSLAQDLEQSSDEISTSVVNEATQTSEQNIEALTEDADLIEDASVLADNVTVPSFINEQGYRVNEDGTIDIVFTFADDCWVSVKDVNGETMAIGVKAKGRIMEVSGLPPVRVILGAPQNVAINFAGQDYDMSVHPGGRSANFELSVESE